MMVKIKKIKREGKTKVIVNMGKTRVGIMLARVGDIYLLDCNNCYMQDELPGIPAAPTINPTKIQPIIITIVLLQVVASKKISASSSLSKCPRSLVSRRSKMSSWYSSHIALRKKWQKVATEIVEKVSGKQIAREEK